ncbi:GL26084, partial [Drosophila persimilis]
LTKQARQMVEELINQLNNAMQIRLLNKFTLYDQPHFDATGLLHSNRLYGPRVSILVDECGATPLEDDVDNFEHVLKMTTHNDALYAYYYTDNNTNKVKVTEIFDFDDMTEHDELATDLQIYEGSVEDHPNPHQHSHNTVVSEWNGVESVQIMPTTPELHDVAF